MQQQDAQRIHPLVSGREPGRSLPLERDVGIALRDGTVTRADIWRPHDGDPVPAKLANWSALPTSKSRRRPAR